MNNLMQINKKLLVFTILIVCAGFIFIGCGTGISPQEKVVNPNAVQNSIDFTDCTGTFCRVMVTIDDEAPSYPAVDGIPLTVEAWVNVKSASTTGTVAARIGAQGGLALVVNNNQPKFLIRQAGMGGATSTERIVASSVSLIQDVWTHIAGILSNTAHVHPSSTCSSVTANEIHHLDILVDGVFTACGTTGSEFASSPDLPLLQFMAVGVHGESGVTIDGNITGDIPFNGIIDEVRLWGVERTSTEINACMKKELGLTGDCNRMNGMVGYMRFNEGQGTTTTDWIGLGSGVKEDVTVILGPPISVSVHEWEAGWSTDTPF